MTVFGSLLSHRTGNTGHEASPTNRNNDGPNIGLLFKNFQTDGALPGDDVGVIKRGYSHRTRFLSKLFGFLKRLQHVFPTEHYIGPVRLRGLELGKGNTQGCENRGFDALFFGSKGNTLGVVTRTSCHHSAGLFFIAEFRDAIVGATDFVGARALEVFTLQIHGNAEYFFEVARILHGSFLRYTRQNFLGIVKIFEAGAWNLSFGCFVEHGHSATGPVASLTASESVLHCPEAR